MEPIEAAALGAVVAKEVIHIIRSNKKIEEAELAKLIASNALKLSSMAETIKAEMAKYGGA